MATCYLCATQIVEKISDDHVVPKQLIDRAQPKAKGFDYGGTISTHETCNNRFGPEARYKTAIRMLRLLLDEKNFVQIVHPDDPTISVMALDGSKFDWLTSEEQVFFKFVQGGIQSKLPPKEFFDGKTRGNPKRDALHIAFSVLAKSAAALLIARHIKKIPPSWRVYASAYWDEAKRFDLDETTGETAPFDSELKVWIKQSAEGDWQVIYKAKELVVVFLFAFSEVDILKALRSILMDNDILFFEGKTVNELMTVGWRALE